MNPVKSRFIFNCIPLNKLFSTERLDESACLKINALIGTFLIISGLLLGLLNSIKIPPGLNKLWIAQIITGITLTTGGFCLLKNLKCVNILLQIHGIVFISMVLFYTFYVGLLFLNCRFSGNFMIGHVPGILAVGMAYGVKQILDFSAFTPGKTAISAVTIFFFISGAVCDLYFVFMIFRSFLIIAFA